MDKKLLNSNKLPFCAGCGHHLIAQNTQKALENLNIDPLDVILVSDIGCHGIIDKFSNSHTVHGLHGRSVALAAGISLGLKNKGKKVIVFIGDGGATIGMQHILEAARLDIDLTVIIHNNMLYGMTGGQASGFTPKGFITTTTPSESKTRNYDICQIALAAKASFVARVVAKPDFSNVIEEALKNEGFSLIETLELCPSYALKMNKGMKLQTILDNIGEKEFVVKNENYRWDFYTNSTDDLLEKIKKIEKKYESKIDKTLCVQLSGSAGEGVQTAGEAFSYGGIVAGLSVNQRGSYPVTVGVGFSTSEVILSPEDDCTYNVNSPDIIIITSVDGLTVNIEKLKTFKGKLYLDSSLETPQTEAEIKRYDFRKFGPKNSSVFSLFYLLKENDIYPIQSFIEGLELANLKDKVEVEKFKTELGI
uniref:Thiamine pyrophosphate enzyme TPP-binding domain-containing protein n=1 Tax=candidate division WOR-3 bacterium TaxID=2052148 RepID=A0A7C3NAF8_UNCW3